MATFVLVPGAWIGAWAWKGVAQNLRDRGHDVYPMSLTGLGERVHLGGPTVDLDTHIADVVNLFAAEDLNDAVLVGHSYSGVVVTGVADRMPERLGHLVFVDSAPFADGQSMLDLSGPEGAAALERSVDESGDGWKYPMPSFEEFEQEGTNLDGLGEAQRALMRAKAAVQPFGTYRQPVRLTNPNGGTYERVAIACNDFRSMIAAGVPPIVALTKPPWRYEELPTGHWPMLSMPDELADLLHRVAND